MYIFLLHVYKKCIIYEYFSLTLTNFQQKYLLTFVIEIDSCIQVFEQYALDIDFGSHRSKT